MRTRSHAMKMVGAVLALIAAVVAVPALAGDAEVIAKLQSILKERYPNTKIDAIRPATLLPGMYEIETSGTLAYIDPSGDHIFTGTIVDTRTKRELTSERWNELNRIHFQDLPLDKAIKIVKGNGSRVVAIFEDPLCPYCRQLEESLVDVSDVTIYTFLYPLEGLHPGATKKATSIWCSADPAATWTDWMLKKTEPAQGACKGDAAAALADISKLADKLKVSGTPTLFFADGHRDPGFIPASQLEKELAGSKLSLASVSAKLN